ncbi:MAG TPA: sensor domain-containing diguanylate cyclase [bacterium]|nr:sensor domain-containing diguanylate cyclase [bacterium]
MDFKPENNRSNMEKDFLNIKELASELVKENAEFKNKLKQKERELDLLYTVINRISFVMDWEEVQETVVELIVDFFPVVEFCLIAVFREPNRVDFKYRDASAAKISSDSIRLSIDINEMTSWDEVVATDEWSGYFKGGTGSVKDLQSSFISLDRKNLQIGFLMVAIPKNREYGEMEWQFLRTIANYCAVALDNSQLYKLAITDTLTGLFNKRYFKSRMERRIERVRSTGHGFSLLMLDLDYFKRINDTYGHPSGDVVLKTLAERIKKNIAEEAIAYRVGGEEFAVVIPEAKKRRAIEIAEKIRAAVQDEVFSFNANGCEVEEKITISIGVSVYPDDADTAGELVSKSDQALYLAKAGGRNNVKYF